MMLKSKLGDLDPRAIMAGALTIATLLLTPLAAVDPPDGSIPGEAIASIVILGLFCTAAAFVLFGALVVEVGAGRALVITYIAPVVALIAGVAVLERIARPRCVARAAPDHRRLVAGHGEMTPGDRSGFFAGAGSAGRAFGP